MFQTFKNAWKVPELKRKLLFTLMILLLYRIGANLPVPFVDAAAISGFSSSLEGTSLMPIAVFSGTAFSQATLFALAVTPYITASIVMQLLTIAIPALERISKDGEEGKKKITRYTRWVTVILAIITAYGYVKLLSNYNEVSYLTINKAADKGMYYFGIIVMVACFCAGAAIVMWLAERITEHGIGNGISMILFANIISRAASLVESMIRMVPANVEGAWGYILGILEVILSVALTIAAIGLIVWFTNSERRIPVQYAKRVVGRKMYGGQSSNLPLKMNMAGVMPVIFASSIVSLPATVAGFFPNSGFYTWVNKYLGTTSVAYIILTAVLIFLFSYFYIAISFNPVEVANNIRNQGGAVPGIRPGKPTSDYIKKILNRVTLLGAVFLLVIDCVPMIVAAVASGFSSIAFTGTSLLIVVGVALETVHDLEAQLAMRNYKGFLD